MKNLKLARKERFIWWILHIIRKYLKQKVTTILSKKPNLFKNNYNLSLSVFYINEQDLKPLIVFYWDKGIYLPHFCYFSNLSIVGSCWACLIELENAAKPLTSCTASATVAIKEKKVFHDSPYAKKSRESNMEFLLINHPLDCPVCEQAGNCDLQDLSLLSGPVKRWFYNLKRPVENKLLGFNVKASMSKCIHCGRCIRFYNEISGDQELGLLSWGFNTEVGTYIKNIPLLSELSANVADICPVGKYFTIFLTYTLSFFFRILP